MSSPVVILGGGFAGLAAAVTLADQGVPVTVLEAKNSLGGRARSFTDPVSGERVDNGQHLFLSGYRNTLRFLERLGTRQQIFFQERLKVSFVEPGGTLNTLDCPPLPAPWHLLVGLWRHRGLTVKDKLSLRAVAGQVHLANGNHTAAADELDQLTVEEWLTRCGQSQRCRRAFWNPLVVATLNEDPSAAAAVGLVAVLKVLMSGSWQEARLGLAKVGLSDLYTGAAQRIIEEKAGRVLLDSPVACLELADGTVRGVRLANGSSLPAEAVLSTVPPVALRRILPEEALAQDPSLRHLERFTSSPILSVNLWLDRPVVSKDCLFVGMIGTQFHWLFNKGAFLHAGAPSYFSLIVSAAHSLIDQPNDALVAMAREDLLACFPESRQARFLRGQVVREREATVSLTVGMEQFRPGPKTGLKNFFLAGDWTATGLPATIESAVISGLNAAEAFKKL